MQKKIACVGFIVDGNRRFARANNLPQLEGHRRGLERVKESAEWVRARGIPHVAYYLFSTENWNRSEEEVTYLMRLFQEAAEEWFVRIAKENVRFRFIGTRERLPAPVREAAERVERASAECTGLTAWICLSYGGRAEIVEAARALARAGAEITEDTLQAHLWSADMPDPDIIVRTGGARRLSNFLLWQSAYSELFFEEAFWPDFSEEMFSAVLEEYESRERRMGR